MRNKFIVCTLATIAPSLHASDFEHTTFLQCGGGLPWLYLSLNSGELADAAKRASDAEACSKLKLKAEIQAAGGNAALVEAIKTFHLKVLAYANGVMPRPGETKAAYAQRVDPLRAAFEEARDRYMLERDLTER